MYSVWVRGFVGFWTDFERILGGFVLVLFGTPPLCPLPSQASKQACPRKSAEVCAGSLRKRAEVCGSLWPHPCASLQKSALAGLLVPCFSVALLHGCASISMHFLVFAIFSLFLCFPTFLVKFWSPTVPFLFLLSWFRGPLGA